MNSAAIDGHRLTIEVSFSGGGRRHDSALVISKSFRESDPVQLPAVLAHHANGDTCEAYPTEFHAVGLALVRSRYTHFPPPSSTNRAPDEIVRGRLRDRTVYHRPARGCNVRSSISIWMRRAIGPPG